MKKLFCFLSLFLFFVQTTVLPANSMVLQAGVSLSEQVPDGFFGSWKITSVMTYSSNPKIFNETTTDYWNLSKVGDVITLTNPVSGAKASVTVEEVKGNRITFSHEIKGRNGKMIETPSLTLNGENFHGTDKIVIEKYKYGELVSSDTVVYKITAEKLTGSPASLFFSSNE